jgi:DNA-binding CsgD family transcriptional regulator
MRTRWLEAEGNARRARALVTGDVDAAREYLAFAERETWESERAHALLVLGLLDVDPGANLAAAYRAFDALGAAPSRRRAAAEMRARSLSVPRRQTDRSSTLTDTEVQLVRLVRDGLSNRQIATAMHYSPKTIEVYLSRLYVKTGFASRLELIRAVDSGALEVGA